MSLLTRHETEWLLAAANSQLDGVYLEIGVWTGETISAVARHAPKLRCVGIDDWSTCPPTIDGRPARATCLERVAEYPQVTVIEQSSHTVGDTWNSPLAICLIDGDHTEDGAYCDLRDFSPWVRPGGILIVDDVWMAPAVNAAVDCWKKTQPMNAWDSMVESYGALRWGDGSPMFKWEAWRRV